MTGVLSKARMAAWLCAGILLAAGCTSEEERLADLMLQLGGGQSAEPLPLPSGVLTDQFGNTFQLASDAPGYVTLVFFGYTSCPDVCPLHMSALAGGLRGLTPDQQDQVRVVFVTTDPERDTPERLRTWLAAFDERFIGLTGPAETVNRMLAELGFPPVRLERTEGSDMYFVGHPAMVLGYTPDGLGRLVYFGGITADRWTHDLDLLTRYDW